MGWCVVETVVWVVVPQVLALLGLLARLGYRAARDRGRQQTVREFVSGLGSGGEVEIDDVRADGSRLRVRLVASPRGRGR